MTCDIAHGVAGADVGPGFVQRRTQLEDSLDLAAHRGLPGVRQDHQKLVPAVAVAVLLPELIGKVAAGDAQDAVALLMTVPVVDLLEVVHVHHNHIEVPPDVAVEVMAQGQAVADAGERVVERELLEQQVILLQLAGQLVDLVEGAHGAALELAHEQQHHRDADEDHDQLLQVHGRVADKIVVGGEEIH